MLSEAEKILKEAQAIAVLTGAGISKESGIPTFRGTDGLWRNYRAEDLATPQAYAKHPDLVWEWYAMRLEMVSQAQPNQAHYLLAELEKQKNLRLVTQNVDGLHARARSENILELHGNITYSRCERCGHVDKLYLGFSIPPKCSRCHARARPNVV
jgi:NAD-dependent deacetylase